MIRLLAWLLNRQVARVNYAINAYNKAQEINRREIGATLRQLEQALEQRRPHNG